MDDSIARSIGHRFSQPSLLTQALTHRSHSQPHNERLEFIGDGVLNCVIALELYRRFPELPEGDLSRIRSALVNQSSLAEVAKRLHLGTYLRLGEGEMRSGGASRPSILADALEAVYGAVFVDAGFNEAQRVVLSNFDLSLAALAPGAAGKDPKTTLQEYLQARKIALPEYRVIAIRGEAHNQEFEVECLIASLKARATGEGTSRRNAEQVAAKRIHEIITAGGTPL